MTVDLILISYLYGFPADPPLRIPGLRGIGAFVLIYLMFITSFDIPRKAIGPKAWKTLHRVGLVWFAYIFGRPGSFRKLVDPEYLANYLRFGIPLAFALIIRITAWQQSRRRRGSRPLQV